MTFPLKTETTITLDEMVKLNKAVMSCNKLTKIAPTFLGVMALWCTIVNEFYTAIALIIILTVWLCLSKLSIKKGVKKYFLSNNDIQNKKIQFEFYQEYVQVTTHNSNCRFEYSRFYKIIETKNNFYLMDSTASAYIIIKENCDAELITFISDLKNIKK